MGFRPQSRPNFRSVDEIPLSRSSLTTKWIFEQPQRHIWAEAWLKVLEPLVHCFDPAALTSFCAFPQRLVAGPSQRVAGESCNPITAITSGDFILPTSNQNCPVAYSFVPFASRGDTLMLDLPTGRGSSGLVEPAWHSGFGWSPVNEWALSLGIGAR
jgi:hypothetical protein